MLARIINDRLFEKLRSVDGAAYTPSAISVWPEDYDTGGYLVVQTQLKPERIPYFFTFVDEVVADLAARPVSADELEREVEPMRKYLARARASNLFWMSQLGGMSRDPRKLTMARTLQDDVLSVTAADIQTLAQRYLRSNTRWSAVVLAKGVQPPALPPPHRLRTQPRRHASQTHKMGRHRRTEDGQRIWRVAPGGVLHQMTSNERTARPALR